MDLEKPYHTIDRHEMPQMLIVYGVGGKLLKAVYCTMCISVGMDGSEWCPVNVGLRHCMMSPWLLNEYMDALVREVNATVLGKVLEPLHANVGRFEINLLLFCKYTALVADSEDKLCGLVSEFGRICESI